MSELTIIEPRYGFRDHMSNPKRPSAGEVFWELLYSINFFSDSRKTLTALNFLFHLTTGILFLIFIFFHFRIQNLLYFWIATLIMGHVYNTIWFHRYCSHHAFSFKDEWMTKLFLWTNPFVIREEIYAIPHFVHHTITEKPGDPYGPHIGWLANYFATEITERINTNISAEKYDSLRKSIKHIGLRTNDFQSFQKTGCVEKTDVYILRTMFSQLFWVSLSLILGGLPWVISWYGAVFVTTFLLRDFNWRGHGGNFRDFKKPGWEFDSKSKALNQLFYGLVASEWHDNHHRFPASCSNGFLFGQFDLSFKMVKLMKKIGIVQSVNDAKPLFQKLLKAPTLDVNVRS